MIHPVRALERMVCIQSVHGMVIEHILDYTNNHPAFKTVIIYPRTVSGPRLVIALILGSKPCLTVENVIHRIKQHVESTIPQKLPGIHNPYIVPDETPIVQLWQPFCRGIDDSVFLVRHSVKYRVILRSRYVVAVNKSHPFIRTLTDCVYFVPEYEQVFLVFEYLHFRIEL